MFHLLINHQVKDYTKWKTEFDSFSDFRKSSGEKSFHIFHASDDANNLTLIFQWENKDSAESFLTSSELKTAMQNAGVLGEPKIQFLNELVEGSI